MVIVAPQGQEFVLHDGTRLRDVHELTSALARMSDAEFSTFVNDEKHDFARWIECSLDEKFLAARARRAHTREQLKKTLFIAMHR